MSASTSYSTVLLVVHLAILGGVHGQHTYWVASNTSQCGGRTPCQTLDSYARDNASLFSTSHTKWIFLQGEHHTFRIQIENAKNITLTGEYPCSSTKREQCSTILPDNHFTIISIHNVRELTIANLIFKSPLAAKNFTEKGMLRLDQIHDLTITQAVVLDVRFLISRPMGSVYISGLNADYLSLTITLPTMPHPRNHNSSFDESNPPKQPWVNVTVSNSTFSLGWDMEKNVQIRVNEESKDGHRDDVQPILCHNSSHAAYINFSHCVFRDSTSPLEVRFDNKKECSKVIFFMINCEFVHNSDVVLKLYLLGPHQVLLENTRFIENDVSYAVIVEYSSHKQETNEMIQFLPSVIVSNCIFVNNTVRFAVINVYTYSEYHPKTVSETLKLAFYGYNIFTNNKPGHWEKCDMVLAVDYVLIGVSGVLEIVNNNIDVVAMTITPTSQLLLHNNSQLRIADNGNSGTVTSTPIQFSVDYSHLKVQQSLVVDECNVDGCNERCVFQFVDDNGMYISEDDLEYFNASIVLSNRGSRGVVREGARPHYLIYNAKLQNCTLTLREGNKTMEEDEKRRILNLDSWDETTIGSPAYYACTCDITQPDNRKLWDCSPVPIIRNVYIGLLLTVALVAVGDYGFVQGVLVASSFKAYKFQNHTVLATVLSELPMNHYNDKCNIPKTKQLINKKFIIEVNMNCPTGFQLSSNNEIVCDCNQVLSNHHFQCTITVRGIRQVITYKSSTNNYWMGYLGQQLVFSDHCLSHYCNTVNSTISTTGLTTEDINTTIQCDPDSNRQGLLCSQCTPGTSSQFGSFRCTQCTFAGLLLVPFGAVAGIGLILFLFLFNFTVLQGDIIGIAFYANAVGIMDEFLLKYSVRPFYIPLVLINLGLGFETCFFDGMDEFSKAIVQFVFPFYLIALLIIIIIAAHKYNLKVFRIRFVARRSVPVLATIMLFTYSGLINAVVYGLQYAHIYNVDSGTYRVVWLHQPELEYFRGKHIAVGVLCLVVTALYLLPLTIVTLLGDLFRMCSHNPWYSHFLDVFHGAFRYPFGFWFGTRLLFRIVFITLNIAINNTSVVAYTIFLTTGSIISLQFLMEPFRTDNVILYRPDPERKITRRDSMKARITKIFRPKVIDSLFLFNVMFITMVVAMSDDISSTYTTVGVCLSISLALAQLITVTIHHTYHYFPLPDSTPQKVEELRERFIGFRERMKERRRARQRRNRADTPDSAPVQIHYLSASMCFNSEEYTSSSTSSGEESDSERNRDDETRGETEDETREETTEM